MYKIIWEDRLSFADIGFESEKAVIELNRIKRKKYYSRSFLEKSMKIIDCCDMVLTCFPPYFFENPPYIHFQLLLKDTDGLIKKEKLNLDKTIIQVQNTKSLLEKIIQKEKVSSDEIDEGINFFRELSHKCYEYLSINKQI